ncbi:MAG TPA: type II secretion system inner membrane protein GspF [Desulfomicrobiaceae bacterium]|nr:type II secretion system inner membrane protein GspF [Desulfomicrobiaceae bacterium]
MAVFQYKAIDRAGRKRRGVVDADSVRGASRKLRAQGVFPSSVVEMESRPGAGKKRTGGRFARVSRTELVAVTRQMATLLGAGLPLVQGLSGVTEQMRDSRLRTVLIQVRERVTEGSSLADALEEHGRVFPATFGALVRAGEASGTLELVMEQLARFEEQRLALNRKIQSTMAYPALMSLTGIGVVLFLLTYVIPRVTGIFLDYGEVLPTPTRVLIAVSSFFQAWWVVILGGLFGAGFLFRLVTRSGKGRVWLHGMLLRMPVVGPVLLNAAVVRFARTLGTLLQNEVPLLTAFSIVRNVVDNDVMAAALDEVRQEVSEGESLVGPLSRRNIFPATVIQMIGAGEQSGHLEQMLLKVADAAEQEVATRLTVLTSLLEPILILVLGGVVGFVVLAVMLPIFEMSHLIR